MQAIGGFLHPEKVLAQIGIATDMKVADFGCGHGYFAIPAGKIAGRNGKIMAIDVLTEALEAVHSQARLEGVTNIETHRGNLEMAGGSGLPDQSMDAVMVHNVLFQSQKKTAIIKETKRVLKSMGNFYLIDWLPQSQMGPQTGWRLGALDVQKLTEQEGFIFKNVFDAGKYHYGLAFVKP